MDWAERIAKSELDKILVDLNRPVQRKITDMLYDLQDHLQRMDELNDNPSHLRLCFVDYGTQYPRGYDLAHEFWLNPDNQYRKDFIELYKKCALEEINILKHLLLEGKEGDSASG